MIVSNGEYVTATDVRLSTHRSNFRALRPKMKAMPKDQIPEFKAMMRAGPLVWPLILVTRRLIAESQGATESKTQ